MFEKFITLFSIYYVYDSEKHFADEIESHLPGC